MTADMTNKELLEEQAEVLKMARDILKSHLETSSGVTTAIAINTSLIAICEQERAVAELQLLRDHVESK